MTEHTAPARRWDPLIKITHWGIAAVVITNALIVGEGSIAHIYAGYTLAALLALRMLWGFIGPIAQSIGRPDGLCAVGLPCGDHRQRDRHGRRPACGRCDDQLG